MLAEQLSAGLQQVCSLDLSGLNQIGRDARRAVRHAWVAKERDPQNLVLGRSVFWQRVVHNRSRESLIKINVLFWVIILVDFGLYPVLVYSNANVSPTWDFYGNCKYDCTTVAAIRPLPRLGAHVAGSNGSREFCTKIV